MAIPAVRLGIIAASLVAMAFAQGCGDDEPSTPSKPSLQINGSVVKSDGKPLDSARIVLLFHTASGGTPQTTNPLFYPNPASVSAVISVEVPAPNTFVNARVLDPVIGTVAASPINNTFASAGMYSVLWDLKESPDSANTIRNGWYYMRLQTGSAVKTSPILVNSENSKPFAVTDSLGKFFIDYRYIPYDSTADYITGDGSVIGRFEVLDTVTVIASRRGYATQRHTLPINRTKPTSLKITF